MTAPLLQVAHLSMRFGGLVAVDDVSFAAADKRITAIIGPNGAGKTTVFNLLTGVYAAQSGTMSLESRPLDRLRPHEIAAAGLARTFQNIRLFGELSVLDNVRVAGHLRGSHRLTETLFRTRRFREQERGLSERALRLLALFDLADRADEPARSLPYGHQRQLEIVRALATEPKVLLLDEPAAGLNSREKMELAAAIRRIRDEFQLAILLIEHDMPLVMGICERITVLDHGATIAEGTPAEIQTHAEVIAAYLGAAPEI